MNNDRDMFYSGYGYGMGPMPNMMPSGNVGMPNMNMPGSSGMSNMGMTGSSMPNQSSYMTSWNQDINNRVDKLERRINRLEQRITRLETPYQNTNYNSEPDNNMYMM